MLNLDGLAVGRVVEKPGQYEIEATVTGEIPKCGCLFPALVKNGRRRSMFFDTPMHGRKVGIWVLRAKLLLKHSCHKREMAPPKFNRSMAGFICMEPTGRHFGVELSTLAEWLDSLPENG